MNSSRMIGAPSRCHMAGLIDLCRKGNFFKKDESVVFVHAGAAVGVE